MRRGCRRQDASAAKRFSQAPSLPARLRKRNLRDALVIAADVADAMAFLHSMDIVHGRLTPGALAHLCPAACSAAAAAAVAAAFNARALKCKVITGAVALVGKLGRTSQRAQDRDQGPWSACPNLHRALRFTALTCAPPAQRTCCWRRTPRTAAAQS